MHCYSILITKVTFWVSNTMPFVLLITWCWFLSHQRRHSLSLYVPTCHFLLVCSPLLLLLLLISLHVIQDFSHMRLQVHGNVCFFLKSMWAAKPCECYVTKLLLSGRSGARNLFTVSFLGSPLSSLSLSLFPEKILLFL